jgi:hypothetical protein
MIATVTSVEAFMNSIPAAVVKIPIAKNKTMIFKSMA